MPRMTGMHGASFGPNYDMEGKTLTVTLVDSAGNNVDTTLTELVSKADEAISELERIRRAHEIVIGEEVEESD